MDPHGPTARRFPLVARFRPACLPLPERVAALIDLADTAARKTDQGLASAVYNQTALLASDVGLPNLARAMCHQHAAAYLHACPLPSKSAIRALEPVVNLARLQIRAGREDDGLHRLRTLYNAVSTGASARFEDITVPAHLTTDREGRQEIRAWLWRVLLADGTRALTTTGRWTDALTHLEEHHGIGQRMLDGRQVAVLAALTSSDTTTASTLLRETAPGDPWEHIVTNCLTVLYRRDAGLLADDYLADLAGSYLGHAAEPGLTVFDIRLGLSVLDVVSPADRPAAGRLVHDLARRTAEAHDGYAAREILTHPTFTMLATDRQTQECRHLVQACSLGTEDIPDRLHNDLIAALETSARVIRDSFAEGEAPWQ
ncbi:hypothetical protein [Streptomyces sp. C36]|uniref:hypothetical protein n=1 Tax=Streptomyces sp. C36 TaxID=3237122 RepID=UPI0034C64302